MSHKSSDQHIQIKMPQVGAKYILEIWDIVCVQDAGVFYDNYAKDKYEGIPQLVSHAYFLLIPLL